MSTPIMQWLSINRIANEHHHVSSGSSNPALDVSGFDLRTATSSPDYIFISS
jgi:hypothetical protein